MTSDWKRVQVSEVCELIVDCVNKTAPRIVEPSEYKMLRTPNIKDGRVDRSDCRFVSRETYEKWTRRAKVLRGDVLLTREAPMGQVGLVDFDDTVFLGQRIMQYRADTSKILPEFLLYSFLSSDLQNQFKAHDGSGSVVSHIRVPDCSKFEIWLPPIVEQEFIVKQLRTLDLKVSVNSNLNALLENLAQAIFKSWFVGFEPTKAKINAREVLLAENPDATPEHIATAEQQAAIQAIAGAEQQAAIQAIAGAGDVIPTEQLQTIADLFPNQLVDSDIGKIPLSWSVSDLNVVTEKISKGTTPRKKDLEKITDTPTVKFIKVKDIAKNGDIDIKSLDTIPRSVHEGVIKRSILKTDDVLFSIAGTIGRVAIIDEQLTDSNCNQALAFIRLKEPSVYRDFIYLLLKTKEVQDVVESKVVQGVQANFSLKELGSIKFASCSKTLLVFFSEIVGSLLKEKTKLRENSVALDELKNLHLPKLLSGSLNPNND